MPTVAIIQARMGSSRLPGKVLADVGGRPLLASVIERARAIPGVDRTLVATTDEPADRSIVELTTTLGVDVFTGSTTDVLDRYFQAAKRYGASAVVRVTGDCPLFDPCVAVRVVSAFWNQRCDYATNRTPPTFPDGLDTEVMTVTALHRAWNEARLPSEREHVTPYLWKDSGRFSVVNVRNEVDLSRYRWTVDEAVDLKFVRAVYDALNGHDGIFGMAEVCALLQRRPDLRRINGDVIRDAGYVESLRKDARGHEL